jgi:hypothetical protein
MNIRLLLKQILFKLGLNVEKISNQNDIEFFISKFKENYKSTELIRIGGDGDGGYLLPNILEKIKFCFSAGVGNVSNFEKELSQKYQIKSFMIDASVNSPPEEDKNFTFIKKFLGSKTFDEFICLNDWLFQSIKNDNSQKILQMDIEGSEFEVLTYESAESLAQFSVMIIEFHGMQNLSNRNFLKMITAIFQKIYCNFSICHVHPNNYSGIYNINGINIPSSVEVTFIRNDFVDSFKSSSQIHLPHFLDQRTVENLPDIVMPEIWWKK